MVNRYPQLDLDRQLCFALYAASRAVVRAYGPLLEEVGLTYPQYVVMLALWQPPARPLTVGELGAELHLDSGTLTPLLKRLEGLGYVERKRDKVDERRVLVELTYKAWVLRDQVESVPGRLLQLVDLDIDQVRTLRDQLAQLVDDLVARPPSGRTTRGPDARR